MSPCNGTPDQRLAGEPPLAVVQEIELELMRVRSEASAARWEARAAELELLLRRSLSDPVLATAISPTAPLEGKRSSVPEVSSAADGAGPKDGARPAAGSPGEATAARQCVDNDCGRGSVATAAMISGAVPLQDWGLLVRAIQRRRHAAADHAMFSPAAAAGDELASTAQKGRTAPPLGAADANAPGAAGHQSADAVAIETTQSAAVQPAVATVRIAERGANPPGDASDHVPRRADVKCANPQRPDAERANTKPPDAKRATRATRAARWRSTGLRPPLLHGPLGDASPSAASNGAAVRRGGPIAKGTVSTRALSAVCVAPSDLPAPRRRRPAAWLCSVAAHLLVLLLLAMMTLSAQTPQDQIALSASSVSPESQPLETVAITAADPPEPSQQDPSEPMALVSPLGELAAVPEVALALPAVAAPSELLSSALAPMAAAGAMQPAPESELTTQFFGVQGGGNHFCYVVDNSLSMSGGRFEGARAELLRSIDQLAAEQRFYVMFYSSELEAMRISQPDQAERFSVMATAVNKQAVRRWAMGVRLQRGGPPDEALRRALQLRPDVIFLLSDGEFPQRIEDLVRELNRSDNLFGDSGPRTIVHTIGYQSREGESRMRRLAETNGGQYRYVPRR